MKLVRVLVLLTVLAAGLLLPAGTASADPGAWEFPAGEIPEPTTPEDPGWGT